MLREQKGITLVALVVTIIVLLILAGVSISLVVGNEGILTRASGAVVTNTAAAGKENIELAFGTAEIDYQEAWAGNVSLGRSAYYTLDNVNGFLTGDYTLSFVTAATEAEDAKGTAVNVPASTVTSATASLLAQEITVAYKEDGSAATYYYTVVVGEKGGAKATFLGYTEE